MEPQQEFVPEEETEEMATDDGLYECAANEDECQGNFTEEPEGYEYTEEQNERDEELGNAGMDTQAGDGVYPDGEYPTMEEADVGCMDSRPGQCEERNQTEDSREEEGSENNKDEYLRRSPEKLKLPKDGKWHSESAKEAVEEKAPPIPVKKGNTKTRIDMFEAM